MTSYYFKVTSSDSHSVKVLSTIFSYSVVAMVTDLCRHLIYDSRGVQCKSSEGIIRGQLLVF